MTKNLIAHKNGPGAGKTSIFFDVFPMFYITEEAPPAAPAKPVRNDVGIADQIAIRSYVLGKSIGKVGKFHNGNNSEQVSSQA